MRPKILARAWQLERSPSKKRPQLSDGEARHVPGIETGSSVKYASCHCFNVCACACACACACVCVCVLTNPSDIIRFLFSLSRLFAL